MAEYIRNIKVREKSGFSTIYPQSKVSAIIDMADALDSYKENFIDPYMVRSVNETFPDENGNIEINSVGSGKEYMTTIGNGTLTTFTLVHHLNSKDVDVIVYDNVTGEHVLVENARTNHDTVVLTFASAPTTNQYRVLIRGGMGFDSLSFLAIHKANSLQDALTYTANNPNVFTYVVE